MNVVQIILLVFFVVSTESSECSPGGTAMGADLGGSSKYSNEKVENIAENIVGKRENAR